MGADGGWASCDEAVAKLKMKVLVVAREVPAHQAGPAVS